MLNLVNQSNCKIKQIIEVASEFIHISKHSFRSIQNQYNPLFIYLKSFQFMRLEVNYKDASKVANSIDTLEKLIQFVQTEFHILKDTIHLYYVDGDGDNITIAQEDDLQIMQAVNQGQEIIKIFVEGNVEEKKLDEKKVQEEIKITAQLVQKEQKEQQVPEKIEEIHAKQEEKPKIEQLKVEPHIAVQQKKEEVKEQHEQGHCPWRKRKWEKIEKYMSQTVARLVDERIKALVPCIREQLAHPQQVIHQSIIHEGYECKGCLKKPIAGIRYQCPSCPQFSLCQNCQQTIDHQHNLLKVKKIIEKKDEEEQESFRHCFRGLFRGRDHHGHRGRSSSSNRSRSCPRKGHWSYRVKMSGMSFMFGGEPEQYQAFIQQNQHLRPRQVFKKYAKLNDISDEEFKKRFIAWRCNKLSQCFGKPAEFYTTFVEENSELRYPELMDLLYEKGLQKREDSKWCWWGKRRHECHKEKSCERSKKSCQRNGVDKSQYQMKFQGMSFIFGGKPEQYSRFIQQNQSLRPRQLFKKYAKLTHISDEEFKKRFIAWRCGKLSKSFGKPAEFYTDFVEENYELRYPELMDLIYEKGIEIRQDNKEGLKVQAPKKEEKKEEKEVPKNVSQKSEIINPSLLFKKESTEILRQKGELLIEMKEIFGMERSKEYYKFIEANFHLGKDRVLEQWIDNLHH